MSTHLTPLQVCEQLIAPVKDLGLIVGMNAKAAYHWQRESSYRDAGDLPPRVNRALLRHAKLHGIPLTERHLIWGADRSEIEALTRAHGIAAQ